MGATITIVGLWLFFAINKPSSVVVPNVKNMTLVEARAALTAKKLRYKTTSSEASDRVPANSILETDPPSGERVSEGSMINLKVSSGARYVQVPALKDKT